MSSVLDNWRKSSTQRSAPPKAKGGGKIQKSTKDSEGFSWTTIGIVLLVVFIIIGVIIWYCFSGSSETETGKKTKKKRKRTTNCKDDPDPLMDISSPSLVNLKGLGGPYEFSGFK